MGERPPHYGKGGVFDLRDRSGTVQVVVVPSELDEASLAIMNDVRPEYVLEIAGEVKSRGEKQVNPDMLTGTIEVLAKTIRILNTAETPPFEIDKDTSGISEELRLKYRYLDLRTQRMQRNIRLRDHIISFFRDYMHRHDFVEIETPILMKGTPEGSREYVVPSRLHAGNFYVLPQSPQQFKQLCMVAGFERYFQVARCFRDEDQRGDRQPEFTQLDLRCLCDARGCVAVHRGECSSSWSTRSFRRKRFRRRRSASSRTPKPWRSMGTISPTCAVTK